MLGLAELLESRRHMSDIPAWREACHCAVSDGVPRRSFLVALVVGAVLNLINQGDALLAGHALDWAKIILTFAVPYCVSTYGAVSYHLKILRARDAAVSAQARARRLPELASDEPADPVVHGRNAKASPGAVT